mgnify:CR=1 FL=1
MKQKIKQLRQRVHDLKSQGKDKLAKFQALEAKADRTDEENAQMAALDAEMDKVAKDLELAESELAKLEKQAAREAAFTVAPGARIQVFDQDPAQTGGFADMAEFAIAVRRACVNQGTDPRLVRNYGAPVMGAPTNFHQEQGGSSGEGFEVPPQMRNEIWDMVFGAGDLLDLVDIEPTSQNAVQFLKDESTPWGSTGIFARWRSEGTQMDAQKIATKQALTQLHELFCFVLATGELLEDAPRLANRLTRKAADAIRWKASDAIMYGTGVGQPLGYFNAPCLVSVGKETSQTADTINVQNIAKMYSRLLVFPGDSPRWLANRDIVPQLVGLTIGNQPVYVPNDRGIQGAPDGFLMGYPVQFTEHAKTLGDKGDIQLVNLKGYYATQKTGGVRFATSIHLFFDYNIEAFRWLFRLGGQPYLSAPVSPANGTNTKSHFVTLDERS